MKYDDASWHTGGDFPENSPQEFGATHIALFMKWCFQQGWAGSYHTEEQPEDLKGVIEGSHSATDYFLKYCDGKLTDEDFSSDGNDFAAQYYGSGGLYLNDYAEHFGELMYVAPESAHDYSKFQTVLDGRLQSGILTGKQLKKSKPWWKFW